jgi:hypothetical protein
VDALPRRSAASLRHSAWPRLCLRPEAMLNISRSRAIALVLLSAAFAFAGCSGDSTSGNEGNSGAIWQQYCQAEAKRRAGCGDSFELESCLEDRPCLDAVYRSDVVEPLTRCLSGRACGQSDDPCFSQAGALHESDPAVAAYRTACLQRRDACQVEASFADDYCFNTGITLPVVQDELTQCLSRPCAEISDCLNGVLEGRGC